MKVVIKQLDSAMLIFFSAFFFFIGIVPQSAIQVEIHWKEKIDESDWVMKPEYALSLLDAMKRYNMVESIIFAGLKLDSDKIMHNFIIHKMFGHYVHPYICCKLTSL